MSITATADARTIYALGPNLSHLDGEKLSSVNLPAWAGVESGTRWDLDELSQRFAAGTEVVGAVVSNLGDVVALVLAAPFEDAK